MKGIVGDIYIIIYKKKSLQMIDCRSSKSFLSRQISVSENPFNLWSSDNAISKELLVFSKRE